MVERDRLGIARGPRGREGGTELKKEKRREWVKDSDRNRGIYEMSADLRLDDREERSHIVKNDILEHGFVWWPIPLANGLV
jgi:hypothetical protein